MPVREYKAKDSKRSCSYCVKGFERIERVHQAPLERCAKCGAPVIRLISAPSVGKSKSGLDDRAKNAGFHKLKKISHGEYEKKY